MSLGVHFIFVMFAGNYILSQDRLISPPDKTFKLEIVKRKLPTLKKPIREIKKTRVEQAVLLKPRVLPKIVPDVQTPPTKLEVRQVTRVVPQAFKPRSVSAVHVTQHSEATRSVVVSAQAIRVPRSAPRRVQVHAATQHSGATRSVVVSAQAIRVPHSAPRRVQVHAATQPSSRRGRLIRRDTQRVSVSSFQPRAIQPGEIPQKNQGSHVSRMKSTVARVSLPKAKPLPFKASGKKQGSSHVSRMKSTVARVSLPKTKPLPFKAPGKKRGTATIKSARISSEAKQFASAFEPRPVPNIIDQGALKGYSRGVQRKIAARKKYPRKAKREGKQGQVTVQFTVMKSGEIKDLLLVAGTSYAELNKAAMDAVKRAAPFPGLPEELGQDFLELVLPFNFTIKK
ncbi:MAG: energy transducer TonB [Nitrospinaceae bacterium]|nr:energy transducer TonB [Nitrospinaceae bacterium]